MNSRLGSRVLRSARCLQAPCPRANPPTPAPRSQLAVACRTTSVNQHPPRRTRPCRRRPLGHLHSPTLPEPQRPKPSRYCHPGHTRRWISNSGGWRPGWLCGAAGRTDRQHTSHTRSSGRCQGAPTSDSRPASNTISQGATGEMRR
jgi:hypothetical protein